MFINISSYRCGDQSSVTCLHEMDHMIPAEESSEYSTLKLKNFKNSIMFASGFTSAASIECDVALLLCIQRRGCSLCCFTCCPPALAGKRRPSDPSGCPVLVWAGRSSSARHTSCTSASDTYCSGFLHTSPGSDTHHSALAETRK